MTEKTQTFEDEVFSRLLQIASDLSLGIIAQQIKKGLKVLPIHIDEAIRAEVVIETGLHDEIVFGYNLKRIIHEAFIAGYTPTSDQVIAWNRYPSVFAEYALQQYERSHGLIGGEEFLLSPRARMDLRMIEQKVFKALYNIGSEQALNILADQISTGKQLSFAQMDQLLETPVDSAASIDGLKTVIRAAFFGNSKYVPSEIQKLVWPISASALIRYAYACSRLEERVGSAGIGDKGLVNIPYEKRGATFSTNLPQEPKSGAKIIDRSFLNHRKL